MTIIANPIYDAVFKFLMEDKKVAKILLSALLKKEIIDLEMRRHEYTSMEQTRISLFRIDFSAKIREDDGSEHLVLIELQKTWLITETLRFRQYLGTQYLDKENIVEKKNEYGQRRTYGLPIISIYILGHPLGDLTEPVVYVRRRYLDYDDNPLPAPDPFIESLTHDSIIVQIPFLTGRTRNRLERLLSVFDQEYRQADSEHYLEINDEHLDDEVKCVVHRLLKAAAAPNVRRAMEIEDEILSEIEDRDTTIMMKNKEIEQKEQVIEQKEQVIEQKEQVIEQKEQVIEQKEQVIEQKEQVIRSMVKMLCNNGTSVEEISEQLSIPVEQIKQYID
ncbi:hypothetical protein [Bacteroides caecimuris]|uniref:Rpn family recombination-promoting nuclease/putative transposase n=1 Tax=Bacteroides caecimuris TaxID=1796613 RepID=A0A4S2CT47_9BACE|nr:hypothetical protein [Bacteroides caecimuris]TGY32057.1 hypothetical protein E5353_12250 [Bacteroides caecimuris]